VAVRRAIPEADSHPRAAPGRVPRPDEHKGDHRDHQRTARHIRPHGTSKSTWLFLVWKTEFGPYLRRPPRKMPLYPRTELNKGGR
jgi:hypothetical protein